MTSIESSSITARRYLRLPFLALFGAMLFAGCDANSPTEPEQPATPVAGPAPSSFTLQLVADPGTAAVGDAPAEVLIRVTAIGANGQPAPDNSTVILSTTLGSFVDENGVLDRSVVVRTTRGQGVGFLQFQPGELGTAVVQGQLNGSFAQTVVEVTEFVPPPGPPPPAPFFVAEVVPNNGSPSGGYTVRIIGSGFDPPFRVLFGGTPAPVRSSTDNTLTVEVPPINLGVGQVQQVSVQVTINLNDTDPDDVQQTDSLPNAFTYARTGGGGPLVPAIFSVTPTSGPNEGGTQVTIRGEGFGSEVQVFFSGGALVEAPILSLAADRIVVRTPSATGPNFANRNAVVDVRVLNLATGLEAVRAGAFQYGDGAAGQNVIITSAGPGRGDYRGGTTVTIFGSGFEAPVAVEFGGFAQQEISVTGTEIIARSVKVPLLNCAETSGPFGVVNIETGEAAVSNILFTYVPIMVSISGIDPAQVNTDERGGVVGSATFTISGVVGFDDGDTVTVTFDDVLAFGVSVDPAAGTITGQIPPYTQTFEEEACEVGGQPGTRLAPARVNVVIRNEWTGCQLDLTNRFTYVPPTTCNLEPPPPPPPGTPPSASFTRSPAGQVTAGATVFFTDTSTGMPTGWQWTFGDGATSAQQNPSHPYAAPGMYTVTLIASNADGSSSTSQVIEVVP